MLRKTLYPKAESIINRFASILNDKGFSPNQLTLAGLILSFITGFIYANGFIFLGGIFILIASLTDLLDGPLARISSRTSDYGAFLDSTIDRYADFFIFGGLALYFAKSHQAGWFVITMGIILGSYVTSYTKAKAENFIKHCNVGIMTRPERIIVLSFGSLLPFLLPVALWLLLIGSNYTAVRRILHTRKSLLSKEN